MTCHDNVTGVPAETEVLLAAKEEICGDAPVGRVFCVYSGVICRTSKSDACTWPSTGMAYAFYPLTQGDMSLSA